ncbi:hypothetical protein MFIFM68171_07669 [Madurella fahalii]|uniref:Uncharacterized protein n=1 Tax=Madurella fahalii TaxID=1157608 RepID=A0ABQ0GIF6_9PEZI
MGPLPCNANLNHRRSRLNIGPRTTTFTALTMATLFLLAVVLPLVAHASPASAPRGPLAPGGHQRRAPEEHVILADCVDPATGVVSSQMAYYPGEPDAQAAPQDTALVLTAPGQAAQWANANTSAVFTTGVRFIAVLGPEVAEGGFAGTGDNGFTDNGGFRCWKWAREALYTTEEGIVCDGVYECDHRPAPGPTPTDSATVAPAGSGLSRDAIIGIVVAIVGTLLFVGAGCLAFWYFRRTRADRAKLEAEASMPPDSIVPVSVPSPLTEKAEAQPATTLPREMDGRWDRVEMANNNDRYELDNQDVVRVAAGEEKHPTN